MEDLHAVGGVQGVMKELLDTGHLDGDCLSVTGQSIGDMLEHHPGLSEVTGEDGEAMPSIFRPAEDPLAPTGHIKILRGNLAPGSAVGKVTGKEGSVFEGPAQCFDGEAAMIRAVE